MRKRTGDDRRDQDSKIFKTGNFNLERSHLVGNSNMVLEIEKQAAVDFRYAQKTCTET